MVPPSCVEVRIEDADLRDSVDGQLVARRGLPDRLGGRGVVDAERLLPVLADVRVDPVDALVRVPLHDRQAQRRALATGGDWQSVRERALDDVPRHLRPASTARRKTSSVVLTDAYPGERDVGRRLRRGDASAPHDPDRLGAPDPAWRTSRPSLLLPSATF